MSTDSDVERQPLGVVMAELGHRVGAGAVAADVGAAAELLAEEAVEHRLLLAHPQPCRQCEVAQPHAQRTA